MSIFSLLSKEDMSRSAPKYWITRVRGVVIRKATSKLAVWILTDDVYKRGVYNWMFSLVVRLMSSATFRVATAASVLDRLSLIKPMYLAIETISVDN